MSACPFCQILAHKLDAVRIDENDLAVAFLDIRPVNPGHTLIVPRRHVASLTELSEQESAAVFQLVQRVGRTLKAALLECGGLTVSAADGEAAGQEVAHAHFHIIPRSQDDGFGWRRFGEQAGRDSLQATASVIRQSLYRS